MPGRKIPLLTGEIYHVLNRGVASQPIFLSRPDYRRLIENTQYYQNRYPPLRYSYFIRQTQARKNKILEDLGHQKNYLVHVIAYCLMPNHFHLLLRQLQDGGISAYMSKLANSYTRYFNTKNQRIGPLLQGKFKSVHVESDNQLLHVSRYIHLNPFSSGVVKTIKELEQYPYSSLPEYLNLTKAGFIENSLILGYFKGANSYRKFIFDQADYQRNLELIKHHL